MTKVEDPIRILIPGMDAKHLFYLGEVIRYGSLSKAAERLGVSQPTLTRVVRILEEQVGAPVVRRGRYGVAPTEVGEALASRGMAIADQLYLADLSVEQWRAGFGEQIRMGVGPMLAQSVMSGFFAETLQNGAGFATHVVTSTAGKLIEGLNEDEFDLVLAPAEMNLHQEKLERDIVFEDRVAVFVGRTSPLFGLTREVEPAELVNLPWISTGAQSGIHGSVGEIFKNLSLPVIAPRISFTGDIAMTLDLLRLTDVVAVMPRGLTLHCPGISIEQCLSVSCELPDRHVAAWFAKSKQDGPKIIEMRNRIRRYFKDLPCR